MNSMDKVTDDQDEGFLCKGCNCTVPSDFSLRTEGYCYLCDPDISVEELLSGQPIIRKDTTVNK